MELNLQTAIMCSAQGSSSQKHLPLPVMLMRQEPSMNQEMFTYSNYLSVAMNQITYVKDIVDALNEVAQNLSSE